MLQQYKFATVFGLFGLASPAFAAPVFYIIQKDIRYVQTTSSAPSTPNSYDFVATAQNPDGVTPLTFNSGTVAGPGTPASQPLTFDGTRLQFRSPVLDQATFNTEFPTGNYSFSITDGTNSAAQTVADTAPESFAPIPFVTNFNSLSGLDSTQPFAFTFNAEGAHNAPGLLGFLFIRDTATLTQALFDSFQPDATQDVVGANVLKPGTQYQFILFFTNNIVTGSSTQLSLNNRTSGTFTTAGGGAAVPEPATAALFVAGMGALCVLKRRSPSKKRS